MLIMGVCLAIGTFLALLPRKYCFSKRKHKDSAAGISTKERINDMNDSSSERLIEHISEDYESSSIHPEI